MAEYMAEYMTIRQRERSTAAVRAVEEKIAALCLSPETPEEETASLVRRERRADTYRQLKAQVASAVDASDPPSVAPNTFLAAQPPYSARHDWRGANA